MYDLPLEPHLDRFTYSSCEQCQEDIILYDELLGASPDLYYAWFDKDGDYPFCCEKCRDDYVLCYAWEYLEENQKKVDVILESQIAKAERILLSIRED